MRRYECSLRDEDLQKALDRFTGGEFSKKLSECKFFDIPKVPISFVLRCGKQFDFGEPSKTDQLTIVLSLEELKFTDIRDRGSFNQHDWNDPRESEPPIDKWMRCEFVNRLSGEVERFIAKYSKKGDSYYWVDQFGKEDYIVDRFRPWED